MAFANIGSVQGTFNNHNSATDDVSAAVASLGANRVGIVLVNRLHAAANITITGVTWNTVAMTQAVVEDTESVRRSAIFYLVGCAHNGTYDIVVTYSAASIHSSLITVAWADATGAISIDDTSSAQGTTQNPTITSTQAGANELVVSGSFSAANALSDPSVTDCTLLQDWDQGGNCMVSAYSQPASSGDVTHQHNYSQSEVYAITSASFKEESAGGTVIPVLMQAYRRRN